MGQIKNPQDRILVIKEQWSGNVNKGNWKAFLKKIYICDIQTNAILIYLCSVFKFQNTHYALFSYFVIGRNAKYPSDKLSV